MHGGVTWQRPQRHQLHDVDLGLAEPIGGRGSRDGGTGGAHQERFDQRKHGRSDAERPESRLHFLQHPAGGTLGEGSADRYIFLRGRTGFSGVVLCISAARVGARQPPTQTQMRKRKLFP